MMQRHVYNEKLKQLKNLKKGASPNEQLEIDFMMFGMTWAIGDGQDESLHEDRMNLLFSSNLNDKRKGEAYRKGMDIVLYSVRGKKKEKSTVILPMLRVHEEIEKGLNNIKEFLNIRTTATIRKVALRWYIDVMGEKYKKDFLNERR